LSGLSVLFEVPIWIERGLESGQLQRVGGVIVEATSKKVVAWLRDGTALNTMGDVAGSAPTPLAAIVNAARIGATLWDGKMTRSAVGKLSQEVGQVSQQMQAAQTLMAFTATGQVLNLALSAATFQATMQRLDRLTQEVAQLGEVIRAEFARDRDIDFRMALEEVRDVFESNNLTRREQAVGSAVGGLYKARENFRADFQRTLNGEADEEKLLIAQHYLIRALYAEISRIRCYLAIRDFELAKQRLVESIPLFREASQILVKLWIGDHPAVFFHKDFSTDVLDRFIQIQGWLTYDDSFLPPNNAQLLFNVVNNLRGNFWDTTIIADEYGTDLGSRITRKPIRTFKDRVMNLTKRLEQAEVVIENYQRFLGFEMELHSLRLSSFDEWSTYISEEDLREHGIGIIVDTDFQRESS
jgi:hypothetical protein